MSAASFNSTNPEMAIIVHRNAVIILSFLWLNTMGLICCFADLILEGFFGCPKTVYIGFLGQVSFFFAFWPLWCQRYLFFVVWAYLVAQYILVKQAGCISLYLLLEKQVFYLVSACFIVAITKSKRQVCILEYYLYYTLISLQWALCYFHLYWQVD